MGMDSELAFIVTGFVLVMVVLALLWFVCAVLGRIVQMGDKSRASSAPVKAPVPSPAPAPATASPVPAGKIPAAHLAVISAAVAAMTDGRGVVTSVFVPAHRASVWAQEGRIEHFSSHRVRSDWALSGSPHVEHDSVERMP